MEPLGIIAGNGALPLLLAQRARACGRRVVVVACEGETAAGITAYADDCEWVRLGQLGRLSRALTTRGVREAVLAGGVIAPNRLKNFSPDLRMITVAARLKVRNSQTIFGALADELAKDGVTVIDPRPLLGEHLPAAGVLSHRQPNQLERADLGLALSVAGTVTSVAVGRTIVVQRGTVLAEETAEGPEECLRRAGAGGGAVAVMVVGPRHEFRFQLPAIEPVTMGACAAGGIAVLAFEAGRVALLDRSAVVAAANAAGMALIAVEGAGNDQMTVRDAADAQAS
jgi:DUF1009 family protein